MNITSRSRQLRRPSSGGFTLIEMIIVIGVILLLTAITVTVISGLTARSEIRDTENTMQLMEKALAEWELGMGRQVTYGRSNNFTNIGANEPNCPGGPAPQYELPQLEQAKAQVTEAQALRESDMLWSILSRASSSREIMAGINPDHLIELDPNAANPPPAHLDVNNLNHLNDYMNGRIGYRFVDAWGNPIIAVMPGRRYQRAVGGCTADTSYCVGDPCWDDDDTIRTPYENRFGVAANRRIYFVSAGPSGRFGNLHLNVSRANLNANQLGDIRFAADNIYSHDIVIEEGRPPNP